MWGERCGEMWREMWVGWVFMGWLGWMFMGWFGSCLLGVLSQVCSFRFVELRFVELLGSWSY